MKTDPNQDSEANRELAAEIAAEATQESVPAKSSTEKKPLPVTPGGLEVPEPPPPLPSTNRLER